MVIPAIRCPCAYQLFLAHSGCHFLDQPPKLHHRAHLQDHTVSRVDGKTVAIAPDIYHEAQAKTLVLA